MACVALEMVAVRVVALLSVDAHCEVDEEVDVVAGMVSAHILTEVAARTFSQEGKLCKQIDE